MELSTSEMLALPPHMYAGRVIYAIILLIKLHKVLSTSTELNDSIPTVQLRLEKYIERLLLISEWLGAEDRTNSLGRAFLIMPQLKQWFCTHMSKSKLEKSEILPQNVTAANRCVDPTPAIVNPAESSESLPLDANEQPSTLPVSTTISNVPIYQHGSKSVQNDSFDRPAGTLNRDLISDSWFWEFFNVNMLD